jgi:hypothetical protein
MDAHAVRGHRSPQKWPNELGDLVPAVSGQSRSAGHLMLLFVKTIPIQASIVQLSTPYKRSLTRSYEATAHQSRAAIHCADPRGPQT